MIAWQEEWIAKLTIHQVEQLAMSEWFNQNHIAKVLIGHIETLKAIIYNLLYNEK